MTREELEKKIWAIREEADRQKDLAYKQYVADNAKYKVGDIVSDLVDTIRIESIHYSVYRDISIFYRGVLLTKKGVPRKDGEKRVIYEEMIINK